MHATNKRHVIEAAALARRYRDEGWTLDRLAAHYGLGQSTIRRRLVELGIAARPRGSRPRRAGSSNQLVWTPALAYFVGALTTDGNLSKDGRHLSLVSKDRDWLVTLATCLDLTNAIGTTARRGREYYRLQWGDRQLYRWLESIGLTPAKSLSLGPLAVPGEFLADFFRGCIDGDGSIVTYVDRYNTYKSRTYTYTRLFVQLTSASRAFLEWLQTSIDRQLRVRGVILSRVPGIDRAPMYTLKYAKKESVALLRWMYYALDIPCLQRKHAIAQRFLEG